MDEAFEFAATHWLVRPFFPVLLHLCLAVIDNGLDDGNHLQYALARVATPCAHKTSRMTT